MRSLLKICCILAAAVSIASAAMTEDFSTMVEGTNVPGQNAWQLMNYWGNLLTNYPLYVNGTGGWTNPASFGRNGGGPWDWAIGAAGKEIGPEAGSGNVYTLEVMVNPGFDGDIIHLFLGNSAIVDNVAYPDADSINNAKARAQLSYRDVQGGKGTLGVNGGLGMTNDPIPAYPALVQIPPAAWNEGGNWWQWKMVVDYSAGTTSGYWRDVNDTTGVPIGDYIQMASIADVPAAVTHVGVMVYGYNDNWCPWIDNIVVSVTESNVPPPPPVTQDSNTWEGRYEANDLPSGENSHWLNTGWGTNWQAASSVSNGILNMNTFDKPGAVSLWRFGYPGPGMNFVNGATVEFRAKVNSWMSSGGVEGSTSLNFCDVSGRVTYFELTDSAFVSYGSGTMPIDTNNFHTYRIVFEDANNETLYIDKGDSFDKVKRCLRWKGWDNVDSDIIYFGNWGRADWDIDYIRWTAKGAFGMPPYCDDPCHPIPQGDFNGDCIVDYKDLDIVAMDWLQESMAQADPNMRNSTFWEGTYEGDWMPDQVGWFPQYDAAYISTIWDGILTMDDYGTDFNGYWERVSSPGFDYENGATIEIRAKMINWGGLGGADIQATDVSDRIVGLDIQDNNVAVSNLGTIQMNTKDALHVYRLTIGTEPNQLRLWVDSGPQPVRTGTLSGPSGLGRNGRFFFGDIGSGVATWDIDYVRWTNQGAFPPPGAASYCGDPEHPFLESDFDYNCRVDMLDFAAFADNWLKDNRP